MIWSLALKGAFYQFNWQKKNILYRSPGALPQNEAVKAGVDEKPVWGDKKLPRLHPDLQTDVITVLRRDLF